ncbi:hypothetical protein HDU97_003936 [Phlyctochytrium planicorne]|nr:hypothetical protein HDU97_003936 [Phlyctochytrium planicorne]
MATALPAASEDPTTAANSASADLTGLMQQISESEYSQLKALAQYSHLAYCAGYPTFQNFNCSICLGPAKGFTQVNPIISPDTKSQGYVAIDHSQQTIFFGFRGAVNMENWVHAAQFPRATFDVPGADANAAVHMGFYDAFKAMKNITFYEINKAIAANPTYRIHALGHSYGCSLATFTVAEMVLTKQIPDPSKVDMSIFACTRLGNFEFARMMENSLKIGKIRRIVHSTDIVPHYPPSPSGYRHFGQEIWLDMKQKKVFSCNDTVQGLDESPSCGNSIPLGQTKIEPHSSYFIHQAVDSCLPYSPANGDPEKVNEGYLPFSIYTGK